MEAAPIPTTTELTVNLQAKTNSKATATCQLHDYFFKSSLSGFSAITLLMAELIHLHQTEHSNGLPLDRLGALSLSKRPSSYRLSPSTIAGRGPDASKRMRRLS
jgi:hypothetical protein